MGEYCHAVPENPEDAVRADDLILISVDDHICEPPTCSQPTCRSTTAIGHHVSTPIRTASSSGATATLGRNLGLNAVAGKPPEMFNVNPTLRGDAPGLLRRRRAGARRVVPAVSSPASTSPTGRGSPGRC
ncbi:MAG: hypothetical protein R2695_14000 [Acidimicrobiales bacterium]